MQFPDLDLSGLPDDPDRDMDIPAATDMDLDLSGLPDPAPINTPKPDPVTMFNNRTVLRQPGLLETFRTPLTSIGRRTAAKLTPKTQPVESPYQEPLMTGLPEFIGTAVDEMSAPINAIPALLTGGASMARGAIGNLLTKAGRIASIPTAISGAERTYSGETLGEKAIGAIEAIGGLFGIKGPTKPNVAEQAKQIIESAPKGPPVSAAGVADAKNTSASVIDELNKQGVDSVTQILPKEIHGNIDAKLPKDLAGAKPRFNIRDQSYTPEFESDIDKALYILAQTNPSKRDADYLTFVMEATGIEDPDKIRELAQQVRKATFDNVKKAQQPGAVKIGRVYQPEAPKRTGRLDYSPSSESAARKILQEYGHQIPEGASNKQIIELAETVKPGWQTTTTKPVAPKDPTVTNPKAAKPKIQINMKGEIIHPDYPDYVLDKDGNILRTISGKPIQPLPPEQGRNLVLEVLNTPRAVNASMDLSFPFRQGVTMMHKKAWWTSWSDMVKSFGSDKAFQGTMDAIHDKPNYKPNINFKNAQGKPTSFADWSGLAITDMGSNRELEHMRSLAERVPGYKQIVGASNRAYTAYANKLRSDVFDSLVDDFTKAGMDPRKDKKLAQTIAGFVNNASGRGSIKELERYMEGLNTVFFSPRLQISRAQMLGKSARAIFDPRVYDMSQPNIRREYLKSMLTLGGAWSTAATLAHQAGAQVSLDPTNPDFMKIRVGDTRMDPGGGFQQFIVLANKIAQQKATSSTTGKTKNFADAKTMYDPTMGNTLGRFARSKMAPLPGAALDLASATQNDQFDLLDTALRMGSPILVQDLMEILANEGISPELLSIPPTMVGIGAQTYGTGNFERKMLGPGSPTDLTFPRKKNQKGLMFP